MIKTVTFKGNVYEIAIQIGELFKEPLQKIAPKYEILAQKPEVKEQLASLWSLVEQDELLKAEITGRAKGSGLAADTMLLIMSPELYDAVSNCTTLMMKKANGEFILCHNEDDRGFNEDNVALIRYDYGDHWLTAYTQAERLCGCFFGYNSYGLAFSSNSISTFVKKPELISRYLLERKIMEAKSVGEAIEITKALVPASTFSINILDIENKKAFNLEKDLDDCYITEVTDRYARSNHFLKKAGEIKISSNSLFRYENSAKLLKDVDNQNVKYEDLREILSYKTNDYMASTLLGDKYQFNANGNMTVANFAVDSETKKVYIRDYIGEHDFCFDYYGELSE